MNLDVMTERVVMQPAWYREIERWVARCARNHPAIVGVELMLRHDGRAAEDEVSVVATGRDHRQLRAAAHAGLMADALHEALDTMDHDLLVHDAIAPR